MRSFDKYKIEKTGKLMFAEGWIENVALWVKYSTDKWSNYSVPRPGPVNKLSLE